MSELSYPIPCLHCGGSLWGRVKYCPYCGRLIEVTPVDEIEQVKTGNIKSENSSQLLTEPFAIQEEKTTIVEHGGEQQDSKIIQDDHQKEQKVEFSDLPAKEEQQKPSTPEDRSSIVDRSQQNEPPLSDIPSAITSDRKTGLGNLKWIALAIAIIITVSGFFVMHYFRGQSYNNGNEGVTIPSAVSSSSECIPERDMALDVINNGERLSVVISMIPNYEKTLASTKKMVEISEKYKPQEDAAEKNVRALHDKRGGLLETYTDKVTKLSNSSPEKVSCALGSIQTSETDPRKKMVAELLKGHIASLQKGNKPNQKQWLSDFEKQFNNYN